MSAKLVKITAADVAAASALGQTDAEKGYPENLSASDIVMQVTGRRWSSLEDSALTTLSDAYRIGFQSN